MEIWKEEFLDGLFKETQYWARDIEYTVVEGYTEIKTIKVDENKLRTNDYIKIEIQIKNKPIREVIKKQVLKYKEIMDRNDIVSNCLSIIYSTVKKHKIKSDTIKGGEINRLIKDIVLHIEKKTKDQADKWIGTIREQRVEEDDKYYNPVPLYSINFEIEDDEGNTVEIADNTSESSSLFFCHEGYTESIELKSIREIIQSDLTKEEKEILNTLAYTNYNKSEASKIIGCSRTTISNKTKKIKDKVNTELGKRFEKISKLDEIEIKNFLDSLESEEQIIKYIRENMHKEYIDDIVYNKLDDTLRQFLISNYIQKTSKILPEDKTVKRLCRIIVKYLYDWAEYIARKPIPISSAIKPTSQRYTKEYHKEYERRLKSWLNTNVYIYKKISQIKGKNYKILKVYNNELYGLVEIVDNKKKRNDKYKKITPLGVVY